MRRVQAYAALVTTVVTAGCASAPEVAGDAPATTIPASAPEERGSVVPVAIVDVNELAATQAPPVVCREILKRGSNVHTLQCGTAEQWKRYRRQEAEDAAALVRMMQGSRFR